MSELSYRVASCAYDQIAFDSGSLWQYCVARGFLPLTVS